MDKQSISTLFFEQFSTAPTHVVQAPGRVNLIGEHTDYNDGFVLPCAINYQAMLACSKRDDGVVNVYSAHFVQGDSFTVSANIEKSTSLWANYVRGVVQCLVTYAQQDGQHDYSIGGANIVVTGNVPQGAGLSSSASLEVAICQAFKEMYGLPIGQTDIALIAQQAENDFVGCNCGIMDQLISAQAEQGKALFIDCRNLETQAVTIPENLAVMIINSNKKRGLVDSEYNNRREQCEQASQLLGVPALRDATLADLQASSIDASDVYRRAHHVITENARTQAMQQALNNNDIAGISRLMAESHASMRDDFAITVPEIDYIVELVANIVGTHGGVRMTGGGFGGCVVALVAHDDVKKVTQAINDNYEKQTGLVADIYICTPSAGAGLVK